MKRHHLLMLLLVLLALAMSACTPAASEQPAATEQPAQSHRQGRQHHRPAQLPQIHAASPLMRHAESAATKTRFVAVSSLTPKV